MQVLDLDAIPYQRVWVIVDMTQPKNACHSTPLARDWQVLVSLASIFSHIIIMRKSYAVFRKDCSPGPGYYIDSATTRFGTGGTPSYSILGRQMDPSEFYDLRFLEYIMHGDCIETPNLQRCSKHHLLVPTTQRRYILREKSMPQHIP